MKGLEKYASISKQEAGALRNTQAKLRHKGGLISHKAARTIMDGGPKAKTLVGAAKDSWKMSRGVDKNHKKRFGHGTNRATLRHVAQEGLKGSQPKPQRWMR